MLNNLFNAFNRALRTQKPAPRPQTTVPTLQAQATVMALPHPEEPMNPAANLSNTNMNTVMNKWFSDWGVPAQYRDYWKNVIDIQVYDIYPDSIIRMGINQDTPAATWDADGKRHLAIKPSWLNPGVIAHEQAHNSYALLTPEQKTAFSTAYTPLKNTDPMIKYLYSINRYGLTSDVEGHAEVYRYIGDKMTMQLKVFYPRLF